MGCFQSKKDTGDIHPNVFRVVNIDEGGQALWSGQLEVTETDLILYREGRDATYWPLASLRRYGFDGEIFSFESGRRCATGEGIYAFRCRRAAMLFRALQQNIQLRNVIQESLPFSLPPNLLTGSPPTMPRQTLQASVVHRSSVDNGQPLTLPTPNNLNLSNHMQLQAGVHRAATQSPRSPSSSDILEVMPLYPRPQNTNNQVTNVYQVRNEIKVKETNNNQAEQINDTRLAHDAQRTSETSPVYSNDIIKDLAMLRQTLKKEARKRDEEEENEFLESQRYAIDSVAPNRSNAPLSPTLSNASEHYAQLSTEQKQEQKDLLEQKLLQEHLEQQQFELEQLMLLEQEQKKQDGNRYYMNIGPNDVYIPDMNRNDVPTTPVTPKQPDYCNFGPSTKLEVNTYANLTIGEMVDSVNNVKHIINCNPSGDFVQKFSESDTYPSLSPVEELEVNYAVLDIDTNRDSIKTLSRELTSPESHNSSRHESTTSQCSAQARGRHLSQSSLEKTAAVPGGYTTIDFDKTVALTSVATTADAECARKTRHNSTTCGSPCSNERCRV